MSLRYKILLLLVAMASSCALVVVHVQRDLFLERFERLEEARALEDMERVSAALEGELERLDARCRAWSSRADVLGLVQTVDGTGFEGSTIAEASHEHVGVDVVCIVGFDQEHQPQVRWSRAVDPDLGTTVELPQLSAAGLASPRSPFRVIASPSSRPGEGISGFLMSAHSSALLVSARLLSSDRHEGPAEGVLILGRFLGPRLQHTLQRQTRIPFQCWPADAGHVLPAEVEASLASLLANAQSVQRSADGGSLQVIRTYPDLANRPLLVVRSEHERRIAAAGTSAFNLGLVTALTCGLVLLMALMWLLQRLVLAPLSSLTNHAALISRGEDFTARLNTERSDEIGALAREIDSMLDHVELARAALVDSAKTAGMSDIATGILHNVGNVLNSVSISATMVAQQVDEMSLGDLARISTVLAEHRSDLLTFLEDHDQGQHLQPLLRALTDQLTSEQERISEEVLSLSDGIEHICQLIKAQQTYAVQAEIIEDVDLGARVEEALHITDQALGSDQGLRVTREFEERISIRLDKHKLLEILVNLIQNARQAMQARAEGRELTLRVFRCGEGKVRLTISDTGVGIPSDCLAKVFSLGFTTKRDGHGYGLHTAAVAASEMGGELWAESAGPSRGSTFVLELPLSVVNAGDPLEAA